MSLATRKVIGDATGYVEKLEANKVVGGVVSAIREASRPYFAAGGVKGITGGVKNSIQMGVRAARTADEAKIARALGANGEAELLEREADMFKGLAETQFSDSVAGALAPAKAAFSGAKAWFVPQKRAAGGRDWYNWGKRMGLTAGGAFIAGTGWRLVTGQGGPFTNDRGQFDVAGIPLV